ncbi:FecR family protein [Sphingopyxis sp. R3-92]|uniref:FecR family protein n=1 Tax=Sphingopyxis sp. R3-92 TaxID=3158553 RepID=UPI003EE5B3F4
MSRADSEATAWLDKMMGPDADMHREAFDEWLAKPGHAKAYDEARDNWNWAGDMSTARIAADVRADAPERELGGRRWAFATILAAVMAVGFAWYLVGRDNDQPIVATNSAQGENRLADGTRVTLMDGARIETRFTDGERRVILHDGRARFEVAHDASRPFFVEAGDSVTRALGTIFEVDLRADVPRIALVEGSVEVRRLEGGKTLRLRPGERAEVRSTGPEPITNEEAKAPAKSLWADNLPLGAILDRAGRDNGVKISLADPALASLRVTGRFDMTDARKLALKLGAALDLKVEFGANGPILGTKSQ